MNWWEPVVIIPIAVIFALLGALILFAWIATYIYCFAAGAWVADYLENLGWPFILWAVSGVIVALECASLWTVFSLKLAELLNIGVEVPW